MENNIIALDESQRHIDKNGHLIIKETVITKEDVNPYRGRDIPDWESHGLDPDKIYYLYRPLSEIEKAVDSFKGKQLLLRHKPVNSKDTQKEITVGAIGSDLKIRDGKLYGDMTFWDQEAIDLIDAKKMEQLSAGYGYDFKLEDGEFNGQHYDGIMTNLHGNHVALVERGRIGNDAIICDEQTVGNTTMKINKEYLPKLKAAIQMAMDEDFSEESIKEVAETFDEAREDAVAHDSESLHKDLRNHFDEDTTAKIMEILGGVSASKEESDKAHDSDKSMEAITVHNKRGNETEMVNEPHKTANDFDPEQLKKEIMDKVHALYQAKDEVKDVVGHVNGDSAEEVYKFALDQMGVDTKGVHPSAYKAMVDLARSARKPKGVAMDSAMQSRENVKKLAPHIKL